jgi:hypothetical protein
MAMIVGSIRYPLYKDLFSLDTTSWLLFRNPGIKYEAFSGVSHTARRLEK